MNCVLIEELGEEHLSGVLGIYNYYIKNTTVTFHAHELHADEMRDDCHGRGIGSMAVRFIEYYAKKKGFHALLAGICVENEKIIG